MEQFDGMLERFKRYAEEAAARQNEYEEQFTALREAYAGLALPYEGALLEQALRRLLQEEDAAAINEERVKEAIADLRRSYLRFWGFPVEAQAPQWAQVPPEWRARLGDYAANITSHIRNGRGVFLGGGTGCGKTNAFALLALAALSAGVSAQTIAYIPNAAELVLQLQMRNERLRASARECNIDAIDGEFVALRWPYREVVLLFVDDIDLILPYGGDACWQEIALFFYARAALGQASCVASNRPLESVYSADGRLLAEGLDAMPGMERVASRWQRFLPPSLRLTTAREDLRATGA